MFGIVGTIFDGSAPFLGFVNLGEGYSMYGESEWAGLSESTCFASGILSTGDGAWQYMVPGRGIFDTGEVLSRRGSRERPDGEEAKNSSTTQKLRKSALYELKKSANKFEAIEDVQRLRQVYYLQARVYHLLPNSRKERDDAANTFARFTAAMCERLRNPPMTALST